MKPFCSIRWVTRIYTAKGGYSGDPSATALHSGTRTYFSPGQVIIMLSFGKIHEPSHLIASVQVFGPSINIRTECISVGDLLQPYGCVGRNVFSDRVFVSRDSCDNDI